MNSTQLKAQRAIEEMKTSLQAWLTNRQIMDKAAVDGSTTAQAFINAYRDHDLELRMAHELHALLKRLYPDADLPEATDFGATVKLAKIAIHGPAATGPEPQGFAYMLPVLAVGGVLVTFYIWQSLRTAHMARMAAEKERWAVCRETGRACPTDWGTLLKWGAILGGAYFLYTKTEFGDMFKRTLRIKGA